MITQLATVKGRLSILDTDTTYDALLTSAIEAISARFDLECDRILSRTEDATDEFDATDTELVVTCYPIETVTKFEIKSTESEGWQEIMPAPQYLIRRACVISLRSPLSTLNCQPSTCRVTYAGGYVLPGTTPAEGQTPLPADIESAAVEQLAFWFTNREKLGTKTTWPKDGVYTQLATQDLLASVSAVLEKHRRWSL